jgi:hypothetical protein
MHKAAAVGCLVLGLALAACGDRASYPSDDSAGVTTEWERIHEIVYLLPDHVPDGWSLRTATERPGRPRRDWTDHLELLADASGERFVVLWAARMDDGAPGGRPGAVEDLPQNAFVHLFAFLGGGDPAGLAARGVASYGGGLEFGVAQLASSPDDQFIVRVANELHDDGRFDYAVPGSALDAGYTLVGSSAGDTRDVSDYTVSWVPTEFVGTDRNAGVSARDVAPQISINVGARFYGQAGHIAAGDAADAPITRDGELLTLEFTISGSPVTVSGRAVSEAELRAFATSLLAHDHEEWRRLLGDRLLVDDAA